MELKFGDLVKYSEDSGFNFINLIGVVIKVDGDLIKVGWESGNVSIAHINMLEKA